MRRSIERWVEVLPDPLGATACPLAALRAQTHAVTDARNKQHGNTAGNG
jgi:hypothetical protein